MKLDRSSLAKRSPPPPQIQVGIGRCAAGAHCNPLYLEVVGVLKTEPTVGQYERKKSQDELIKFPTVMILLVEEGTDHPDTLLMRDAGLKSLHIQSHKQGRQEAQPSPPSV